MLRSRPAAHRGQWSLIGTLVAIAILIALVAVYMPRIAARHSAPGAPATPRERAYGAACTEYASQMNLALQQYKDANDGKMPASLDELKQYGVTDEMIHAPGCAFQIDPATGTVADVGQGRALPGQPYPAPGAPAGPRGGTRGPGGITLPNIPGAAGG